MAQDANGNDVKPGDIVSCKFKVMDLIADSDTLNLLVAHDAGHNALPDDWRIELESSHVELVSGEEKPPHGKPPEQGKADASATIPKESELAALKGKHK
jgi:hypothetical protein